MLAIKDQGAAPDGRITLDHFVCAARFTFRKFRFRETRSSLSRAARLGKIDHPSCAALRLGKIDHLSCAAHFRKNRSSLVRSAIWQKSIIHLVTPQVAKLRVLVLQLSAHAPAFAADLAAFNSRPGLRPTRCQCALVRVIAAAPAAACKPHYQHR